MRETLSKAIFMAKVYGNLAKAICMKEITLMILNMELGLIGGEMESFIQGGSKEEKSMTERHKIFNYFLDFLKVT